MSTIASTNLSALWDGGSLSLALAAGLMGAGLLLILRLLRGQSLRSQRRSRTATSPVRPSALLRARARAAYAGAKAGGVTITQESSPGPELPIPQQEGGNGPDCPAALSRRIDRLEARVQARRAASRG